MTALVLGLIIFFAMHSVRIVSDDFRTRQIEKVGIRTWRAMYAAVSLAGLVLIIAGYGVERAVPTVLWYPPTWLFGVAGVLMIASFVLIAASFVPGTRIRSRLGHPMVLGIKVWAAAHLLANGTVADVLVFGAFLVWSVAAYASARRRDRAAGTVFVVGPMQRDVVAVGAGLVAWALFAIWVHRWLFGVVPLRWAAGA